MKLNDALRTDSELRDDVAHFFDQERERCIQDFENAEPTDHPKFSYLKARLDVVRQLRFSLLKEFKHA